MKIHINALKATIDEMFSELVHEEMEIVKLKNNKTIENRRYNKKVIDTKDKTKLTELANKIINHNPDNKDERVRNQILEGEIDKANEYQNYFPNYKSDREERKYYNMLQDWKEFLEEEINQKQQNSAKIQPKVKWNGKNKNDLAYLFWKLQKENIISVNDFGLTLSKIFNDNEGKPIKNNLFNKYSSEFNKNQFPANAADIDQLIQFLKKQL